MCMFIAPCYNDMAIIGISIVAFGSIMKVWSIILVSMDHTLTPGMVIDSMIVWLLVRQKERK